MPYTRVDPEEFLQHNDVTVYHTYKDDDIDQRWTYWFTTDICECSENQFDIRDLSTFAKTKPFEEILKEAIDKGEITMPQED